MSDADCVACGGNGTLWGTPCGMCTEPTVYQGVVVEDPDQEGELLVELAPEMVDALRWKPGDVLIWEIDPETGAVTIRKDAGE